MHRRHLLNLIAVFSAAVLLVSVHSAFAQLRIVGSISGIVQDPTGAVVPNARVVLKDQKTALTKESTTTEGGTFLFPDLATGLYQVTVSLSGFKTELLPNISVSTNKTTDVRITLEVGEPTETVTITSDTAHLLDTSSQLIIDTLTTKAVTELPLGNRSNALALARLGQGASPPTNGDTRYNNLPGGAVNVTVDGINNASNGFKSGGTVFFVTVPVRVGAVDEVTVETGGLTAESGAQSGANIKFTTKRGGESYHGSVFYEPQSERFNSNTWSRNAQNLPRLYNRTQNYGGNVGGPLIPFGSYKKRAFFFVNYERAYSPVRTARTIFTLTPDAQNGNFTYLVSGTTNQLRTMNVLTLAAAKGLPTKIDPVVQSILTVNNKIPQNATKVATLGDFNHDTYIWPAENNNYAYFPATRFDVFVTPKQQFTWSWNYRHNWQAGERRIPVEEIQRTNPFRLGYFIWSAALQSTFSPRTLNEARYGVQHSGDTNARAEYGDFYTYNGVPLRIGGNLPFGPIGNLNLGPTVPFIDQANVTGRHSITTIYDTLTLNRGEHTITLGGSYRSTEWNDTQVVFGVPSYATGTPQADPLNASSAFTTTTLPGINSTELGNPLALYNALTGRVASASFTKVVNPDTFNYDGGINYTFTASKMGGAFIQDRWRFSKTLTLQFGLRWEYQGPMHDTKGLTAAPDLASLFGPSKSLFTPGVLSGNNNPTIEVGRVPYKGDWKNLAPNFGFAWNPNFSKGWLGKLAGGDKTVIRGYYGLVYYDEGTQFFAANLGPNVGKQINGTTLVPGQPGQTNLPAFYTLSDIVAKPLTASSFAFTTNTYAKTINQADQTFARTINGFDPTLRAPYTINWDFGIQRQIGHNTVIEARYVGNQGHLLWRTSNLNEVNIFENGFLQEFKNAQNNLAINQAAGVNSFQNLNRTGQVALPIFDAAFLARGALDPVASSSGYQSTTFINNLLNGEAGTLANTLATNQNYVCRMFGSTFSPCARVQPKANVPGPYPINFFLLNPFVAGRMNFIDDTGWSSYNGLQFQFRQRLSRGLNWSANWTWSKSMTNLPVDTQNQNVDFLTLRNFDTSRRESLFDIRHVIQVAGTYDLPVGRGKKFALNNSVLDAVFGGWTVGSIVVFHTGQPIQLTNGLNNGLAAGFGTVNNSNNPGASGVRLAPGVTLKQIEKMFHAKLVPLTSLGRAGATPLQMLAVDPNLIGPDGRANPAFIVPNRTPGDFGQILFIRDRNTFTWDASLLKSFRIMERTSLQLFAGFNDVLNHPRWGIPDTNVFSTTFGVVTGPGYRSTSDPNGVAQTSTGNYGRTINLRATLSF